MKNCDNCGNEIQGEAFLCHEVDGEILCDDCYREEYEFVCCRCGEHGDAADQHNMLVVISDGVRFSATGDYVPTGIYKITETPYYGSDYLSSWLFDTAIQKIAEVPDGIDEEFEPCGHLCAACQAKVRSQQCQ